jgi:hypothetical protein
VRAGFLVLPLTISSAMLFGTCSKLNGSIE